METMAVPAGYLRARQSEGVQTARVPVTSLIGWSNYKSVMLHKKNKPSPTQEKDILEITDLSGDDNGLEVSTRFLRGRENQLDRQTLRLAQALIEAGFKVTDPRLT